MQIIVDMFKARFDCQRQSQPCAESHAKNLFLYSNMRRVVRRTATFGAVFNLHFIATLVLPPPHPLPRAKHTPGKIGGDKAASWLV